MSTEYFLGAWTLLKQVVCFIFFNSHSLWVMHYLLHYAWGNKGSRGFTKPQSHGQPSPVWLSSLHAELIPNTAFISKPEKAESTPAPCWGHPQLWHLHNPFLGLPKRIHSFPQTPKFNGRCITVPSLICTSRLLLTCWNLRCRLLLGQFSNHLVA